MTEEQFDELVTTIIRAYSQGVLARTANSTTDAENWELKNAIFFSTTVITTIGKWSPVNTRHKIFTNQA